MNATEPVPFVLTDAGLSLVDGLAEVPTMTYEDEPQPACDTCLDAGVVLALDGPDQIHITCPDCGTPDPVPAVTSTPAAGTGFPRNVPDHTSDRTGRICLYGGLRTRSGYCPAGCVLPEAPALMEVPC